MYTADKSKDHTLMGRNTTLTLGHIAVALRHEEKVCLFLYNRSFTLKKKRNVGSQEEDIFPLQNALKMC